MQNPAKRSWNTTDEFLAVDVLCALASVLVAACSRQWSCLQRWHARKEVDSMDVWKPRLQSRNCTEAHLLHCQVWQTIHGMFLETSPRNEVQNCRLGIRRCVLSRLDTVLRPAKGGGESPSRAPTTAPCRPAHCKRQQSRGRGPPWPAGWQPSRRAERSWRRRCGLSRHVRLLLRHEPAVHRPYNHKPWISTIRKTRGEALVTQLSSSQHPWRSLLRLTSKKCHCVSGRP